MTHVPPPAPKPKKTVWVRWWMILVYIVVAVCLIGGLAGALGDPDTGGVDGEDDPTSAEAAGETDAEAEPVEEVEDFFEAQTFTGSGDEVLDLPAGAEEGIVTASHDGSGAFIIDVLNDSNESTGDLLVTAIGSYEGTTAFGLWIEGGTKLQVQADGDWEITVAHFSEAPELGLPADGEGDAVYRYSTEAASWHFTHDGSGAFIVQSTEEIMGLLVTEIGTVDSTVPMVAGEGILTIKADGSWTIAQD